MAQLDDLTGPFLKQLLEADKAIIKMDESWVKFYTHVSETSKAASGMSDLIKGQKDLADNTKKLTETEKEQQKAAAALDAQRKKGLEQMAKAEAKEREMVAAMKMEAKTTDELQRQIRAFEQAKKKLNITTEEGRKKTAEYNAIINKNTEIIRQNASAAEKQRMNIGNYASAFKNMGRQLMSAIGLTSGILLLVGAIKGAFNISKEFQKGQSNLAAVLGKTTKETKALSDAAIELGGSTVFSAREVTGLQTELAKLGFTENQILTTSRAILDFAAATNASLPEAAKVTGVALRAYGLSMADAEDVTATLAVATTKSALAFADYETVLSTVGPIAKTFGFSLEDTVALMGTLKNAGFDASTGATALRNILLNLADTNGALAKELGRPVKTLPDLIGGLKELKDKGVDLNTTLQLTDKRSVAAFNTFISGTDTLFELKEGVTGVKDELQQMVEVQLDNIAGDITLLSSAWEGFVLSIEKGDGAIGKFIRGTLQLFTGAIAELGNFDLMFKRSSKYTEEQWSRAFDIIQNLGLNTNKEFKKLVSEFNEIQYWDLSNQKAYFIERAKATGLSNVESEGMWNVYINRRMEQKKAEVKAEGDHVATILAEAEKKKEGEKVINKMTEEELKRHNDEKKRLHEEELKLLYDVYRATTQSDEEAYQEFVKNKALQLEAEANFQQQLSAFKEEEGVDDDKIHEEKLRKIQEEKQAAIDAEAEKAAERQRIAQESIAALSEIGNQLFELNGMMLQQEFQRFEQQKAHELSLAGDNAERRAAIEEKYAKKEAELKRKQAKADKSAAIFRTIINIAQSITAMLTAGPVGIVLAALSAAMGAIQLGVIASQPIPQFFKGTESAPDGVISVAEKGREIVKTKSGQVLMVNEPTLASGLKGAKIYSNPETEAMMKAGAFGYDSKELQRTLERNNDRLIRTIQNKKEIHISASKREITERSGGTWTHYKNSYFR